MVKVEADYNYPELTNHMVFLNEAVIESELVVFLINLVLDLNDLEVLSSVLGVHSK